MRDVSLFSFLSFDFGKGNRLGNDAQDPSCKYSTKPLLGCQICIRHKSAPDVIKSQVFWNMIDFFPFLIYYKSKRTQEAAMKKVLSLAFQVADVTCRLIAVNPRNVQLYGALQHSHSGVEIHCVHEGEMTVDSNRGNFVLTNGHMLVLPANVYHCVRNVSPNTDRMDILIELGNYRNSARAEARQFLKSLLFHRPILLHADTQQDLFSLLGRVRNLVLEYRDDFVQQEQLKALCTELVLQLGVVAEKNVAVSEQTPYESFDTAKDRYIMDEFFNQNYHGSSSLEDLAKLLNLSVRQADRELKQVYGKGFREKMNECRLAVAVDLLRNTTKDVTEIAEMLGYSDPANFSSFVKRQTGQSPSQIRKAKTHQ